MSDETKMTEAEANTEEQPANETPTEDSGVAEHLATAEQDAPLPEESAAESAPQVVAEAVAEPVAEAAASQWPKRLQSQWPKRLQSQWPKQLQSLRPKQLQSQWPKRLRSQCRSGLRNQRPKRLPSPRLKRLQSQWPKRLRSLSRKVMKRSSASAEVDAGSSKPEQVAPTFNRVEGPAIFNRAKQGNQRRNPRHVGNDVRIDEIGYKNVQVLSRFVDNYGRIHNRRKTRVTAKMQRKVTKAIKRARHLALMPYTGEHIRITGRRN